jgi:hypothetical protein
MRWQPLILVPLLFALPLLAADRPPQQVVQRDRLAAADTARAATSAAVSGLYDQIGELPLTATLTVAQFLKDLQVQDEFTRTLQRADQIGAPRWVDEYTCQVQLEIPALRVSYALRQLAAAYPRASPLTPAQIERAASRWPCQTFAATGSSASSVALPEFRPPPGNRWAAVTLAERRKALAAANSDATYRAMSSVSPVALSDQKTLGDGFAVPEVGDAVRGWLSRRPVTRVDFRDDLQVEVALGVDRRDYFNVVRAALTRQRAIAPPNEEEWSRVERDFSSRFYSPVGRAAVSDPKAVVTTKPAFHLPQRAPEWAHDQIDVQGLASGSGPKLKTALAAEADARAKLHARIENLQLDRNLTVADAAKQSRLVADAVARFVKQAHIFKTEYRPDGTVVVRMSADLGDLWEEMHR